MRGGNRPLQSNEPRTPEGRLRPQRNTSPEGAVHWWWPSLATTPARSNAARIAAIGPTGRRACDNNASSAAALHPTRKAMRAKRQGASTAHARASSFQPCASKALNLRRDAGSRAHHRSQRPAARQSHPARRPTALPNAIHGRRQACRRHHAEALREPGGQYAPASEPLSGPRHAGCGDNAFAAGPNLLVEPQDTQVRCDRRSGNLRQHPLVPRSSAQRTQLAGDDRPNFNHTESPRDARRSLPGSPP